MISRYHDGKSQRLRIQFLTVLSLGVIGMLAVILFRMQVMQRTRYEVSLSRQSIRRVRLPAQRGRIFDRAGRVLADNRPSYELVLYLEEFRRPGGWENTVEKVMTALEELSVLMQSPAVVGEEGVRRHIRRRLPLPLVAWRDLDEAQMARFAERQRDFSGVDIQPAPLRTYPFKAGAGNVIGYVGRADPSVEGQMEAAAFYLPEFEGKAGIEAQYNRELRGTAGGMLLRVDAAGYLWEEMPERSAVSGADIQLTLDMDIQEWVERELEEVIGAAVVIDPRNGDVLAMASSPHYDFNKFVPVIRSQDWEVLRSDERAPLLNRAVAGRYPPGSLIKPLVAVGALVNDVIDPETSFECTGSYNIGPVSIRCWQRRGHGSLRLRRALTQSCNPYFIDLALRGGYEMLLYQAAAVGLGTRSGIDLPHESPGLLPDDHWKRRMRGDGWRSGDTGNVAIGQGDLLVTPLQMAVMTSALANGGSVWQPRLAKAIWQPAARSMELLPTRLIRVVDWPPEVLAAVQRGLHDVVHAPDGTGRLALTSGVRMGGKTGTSEVGPRHLGKKHGWMIAYAPFESPRYAVAMIVEDAESGGVTVAPRVGNLMRKIFGGEDI